MLNIRSGDNTFYLDPGEANTYGSQYQSQYREAVPYPHIVIDNFLPMEIPRWLAATFPLPNESEDRNFLNPRTEFRKRQVLWPSFDPKQAAFFNFMNSAAIIKFLESLTGIEGLLGDPYFAGGGYHEIFSGGKLGLHADFRLHPTLNLTRRINLLLYLNDNWSESFGGNLEIWDQDLEVCYKSIPPVFNRCIIFNTDDKSYHGHPKPLECPLDRSRRSIALYYYTAKASEQTSVNGTMFVPRPDDPSDVREFAFQRRMMEYLRDEMKRFNPTESTKEKISIIAKVIQGQVKVK